MYTVNVENPEKVGEKNSYVVYTVRSTKTADNTTAVQQRRYNDFMWFYEHLKTAHPSCVVPQIPEKTLSLCNPFFYNFMCGLRALCNLTVPSWRQV